MTKERKQEVINSYKREENDINKYLSVKYSMPEWIIGQWIVDYGKEKTINILEGFYADKPITIRTNLTKCTPGQLKERLRSEGVKVKDGSGKTNIDGLYVIVTFPPALERELVLRLNWSASRPLSDRIMSFVRADP